MPDNLSLREAAFAAQYVAKGGNGTKAAIAAGYAPKSAHVSASLLIRRSKVKKRIEQLTKKHEITADRVLTRLDNLSAKAEEEGLLAVSVKAEELLGRALGLFIDRSVNVNVDITSQHIDAIRALAAKRSKNKGARAGDDALDVSASTSTSSQNAICHNADYAIADGREGDKSVIDQRTSQEVLTPSTLKQSPDQGE